MNPEQQPQRTERKTLTLSKEGHDIVNWGKWTEEVHEYVKNGEIEKAAHLLACCFDGDKSSDEKMRTEMFTSPTLIPYHEQLWKLIRPEITPEFQEKIRLQLIDQYGWDI